MDFKDLLEDVPTINTTSVGNSSIEGGSANFADKVGNKKKKCKCDEKECECNKK